MIMSNIEQEFYTPKELAGYFRVTIRTVYRMMERGELEYYSIGGSIRFRKTDIEAYVERNKHGGKA